MNKRVLFFSLLGVLSIFISGFSLDLAMQWKKWKSLFDGKTLQGWHTIPGGEWKVKDGAIVGLSDKADTRHGLLVTDRSFQDFENLSRPEKTLQMVSYGYPRTVGLVRISSYSWSRTDILVQLFRLRIYLISNMVKIMFFTHYVECFANVQNIYRCFILKRFAEHLPGVKLGKSFSG